METHVEKYSNINSPLNIYANMFYLHCSFRKLVGSNFNQTF